MDDTPYIHDGADASLRKTVSLLNKIEAKTGSATITGPVTVTNEVEIKNDANNPLPVSDNGGSLTVDGTVTANTGLTQPLTDTQLRATAVPVSGTVTANTGLTQPLTDTQLRATAVPVSGTVTANTGLTQPLTDTQLRATAVPISGTVTANTGLTPLTDTQLRATAVPVSGTFFQGTQPVSLDSVPSHPVTGSGSFTAAQATAANLNATVVGSGSFTAAQATASNLKAQAQLLNASGSVVDYAMTGTAGTPATDVVSVQGIAGAIAIPVSGTVTANAGTGTFVISDKGATGESSVTSFTSTSSAVLKAFNSNRKLLTIFNEGVGTIFILLGSGTASTANYSLRLLSGDYYELEKYTGEVNAIFSSAGTAKITEIT